MILFTCSGRDAGRMGDSLAMVPFMVHVANECEGDVFVRGLNPGVMDLVHATYPDRFTETEHAPEDCKEYVLDIGKMYDLFQTRMHMVQSYFAHFEFPIPNVPISLPFPASEVHLVSRVCVLAPYSWSDRAGNKFWSHINWIDVINKLREWGLIDHAYVVGSGVIDDPHIYENADVEPFFDRPLVEVLDLIRRSRLLLSVDNGISHLAHYGGVAHHALLYPGCLAQCWVQNPRAIMVQREPHQISVNEMTVAAREVIQRGT